MFSVACRAVLRVLVSRLVSILVRRGWQPRRWSPCGPVALGRRLETRGKNPIHGAFRDDARRWTTDAILLTEFI